MNWKSVAASLLLLGGLLSGGANATSLEITPVAVHLVPGQKATTIKVMNRGGVATAIHLRAYAWAQSGDKDVLTPTHDIILSPPIFTVASGGTQTIRLLLRPGAADRKFRLLIDEVPPVNLAGQNVVIAMRISIPVMVTSAAATSRKLQWRARRGPGDTITLTATNFGSAYDRVHAISAKLDDGSQPAVAAIASNTYIFPGVQRRWTVRSASAEARQLRLSVTTQGGKGEQILVVDP